MKSYLNNGFGRWTAETRSAEVLIRVAGIMISGVNEKTENGLGYIIRSPFWNNGYVTEAAAVILCVELDSIGLSRIVANIPHDHSSPAGVAKKTVMKKEFEFINKRNRDILTYLYAINKD